MKQKLDKPELENLSKMAVFLMKIILKTSKTKSNQKEAKILKELFNKQQLILQDLVQKHDVKAVKYHIKELELWILHLPVQQIEKITKAYFKTFGKYLGEEKLLKKANKIIKSRSIKNLKEYELLMTIVELYNGAIEKWQLVELSSNLINDFEKRGIAKKITSR